MKMSRGVASLAVAAAATMGVLAVPGTANASSGGGCGTFSGAGETLESCISASGAYLEPDGYIIKNTGCAYAFVDLVNPANDALLSRHQVSCSLGHKGPFPYAGTNGQQYETDLWTADSSGIVILSLRSWPETFHS